MKQAVLSIYYVDPRNKKHHEPQGKFFYAYNKAIYLADMTSHKWWNNYGGYSISKQILDAFSRVGERPTIVYRIKNSTTFYTANMTTFKKMGVLVAYGGHAQYVLPIGKWKVHEGKIKGEAFNLPVVTVANWIKSKNEDPNDAFVPDEYVFIGDTAYRKRAPSVEQQSFF